MRGFALSRWRYWTGARTPLGPNADLAFIRDFYRSYYGTEEPTRWQVAKDRLRGALSYWRALRRQRSS